MLMTTVLQISNTGTDVPVVKKNPSVDGEAIGDDDHILLLDLGEPHAMVMYAVQLNSNTIQSHC
jgi:hypothetical protein